MANKADMLAKIAAAEAGVIKLQADLAASGIPAADEAEVDAALTHLSEVVNPVVQNPPDVPPDPGLPIATP
jgi:hypothetical protein